MTSKITEAMLRSWQSRGLTLTQAAKETGLPLPTIRGNEKRFGIKLRRERAPLPTDECQKLAEEGLTAVQTAARLGIPVKAIKDVARRRGIVFRSIRGEVQRKPPVVVSKAEKRVKAWSCSPAAIQRALAQRGMQ